MICVPRPVANSGTASKAVPRERIDDETEDAALENGSSADGRTVARIRGETIFHSRRPFRYSRDDMLVRLGWIQCRLREELGPSVSKAELGKGAN